jgi:hypothetical protein
MGRNYSYFVYGQDAVNIVTNQYANFEGNKIHEYITSRPLALLDMSDVNTIILLMNLARKQPNVQHSIAKSFRILNGKVIRKSKLEHDLALSRFICSKFDGYYAPPLNKKRGGVFHQEIMLCLPHDKVTFISSMVPPKALKTQARKNFENRKQIFNNY